MSQSKPSSNSLSCCCTLPPSSVQPAACLSLSLSSTPPSHLLAPAPGPPLQSLWALCLWAPSQIFRNPWCHSFSIPFSLFFVIYFPKLILKLNSQYAPSSLPTNRFLTQDSVVWNFRTSRMLFDFIKINLMFNKACRVNLGPRQCSSMTGRNNLPRLLWQFGSGSPKLLSTCSSHAFFICNK